MVPLLGRGTCWRCWSIILRADLWSLSGPGLRCCQGIQCLFCCSLKACHSHVPGVIGREVTVDFLSFGSFNACNHFPSCCFKRSCLARPERRVPGSQKRSDLCMKSGCLDGVDSDCSTGGDIIHTLTDVAGDGWCIFLQIHLSSICCCVLEVLPVSAGKADLECY